ncbi:MAG TPA: hypothetical protein VGR10_05490, partial [Thermoleophilaceae bacterium]|nr:hypothetical protein [Thermoleophilaceae bacterium]
MSATRSTRWTAPGAAGWRSGHVHSAGLGPGHDLLGPKGTDRIDTGALERDLKGRVEGEVRFDAGTRAIYSHDSSNYRQAPIGVVIPKDLDDVVAAVAACREHSAPVLSRGCATS